jgi:hypothetical protein
VVQEIKNSMGMGDQMPPEVLQQKLQQAEQALKVLEDELKKSLEKNNSKEARQEIQGLQDHY